MSPMETVLEAARHLETQADRTKLFKKAQKKRAEDNRRRKEVGAAKLNAAIQRQEMAAKMKLDWASLLEAKKAQWTQATLAKMRKMELQDELRAITPYSAVLEGRICISGKRHSHRTTGCPCQRRQPP